MRLIESSRYYLNEFSAADAGPINLNRDEGLIVWKPPTTGTIKINFDASIFRNPRGVGIGVVARDSEGKCLCRKIYFVKNILDPTHAEALAARVEAHMATDFSGYMVELEGDYLTVIQDMNSRSCQYSFIGPIVGEICSILDSMSNVY
ncbi:UNVERIFIED_CONTAM: hypothetical protein Sradi_0745500 [Sesamum radiatum]|uniref:RNase H type-1 domain-containing protein n=1 Tax=Sesamum radiatum TaxID=300843 RepID=A0AAW2VQZ0_SESRA